MSSRQCHREKLSEFPIFPGDSNFMSSRKTKAANCDVYHFFAIFPSPFISYSWFDEKIIYLLENMRRIFCLEHLERFPLETRAK